MNIINHIITIITLTILIGSASSCIADDTVVVVPLGRVVNKEVCNGVPVGNETFTAELPYDIRLVSVGQIYQTNTGYVIIITGTTKNICCAETSDHFYLTHDEFPDPLYGVKGKYYSTYDGEVVYAYYL